MTANALTTIDAKPLAQAGRPRATDWQGAAGDWLANLGSDRTRRAYREAWAAFLAFAQLAPDQVGQSDVIAYRRHLETTPSPRTGRPYTQATINLHLTALSSFFSWAKDKGLREDNPVDGVTRKAVTPYGKATWLDPEAGEDLKLLGAVDTSTPQGIRDRALLLIFLTLGLRLESVARLKAADLRRQGDATFLTVTAKGNKTREVRLAPVTADAIAEYLKTRPALTAQSPIFVATPEGRDAARRMLAARGLQLPDEETAMTPRAIAFLVRAYCDKAFGPGHGIHPHSLRHTAAKIAEAEGHKLTEIGALLGHASLQVTTIYLHATDRAADRVTATLGRRYSKA